MLVLAQVCTCNTNFAAFKRIRSNDKTSSSIQSIPDSYSPATSEKNKQIQIMLRNTLVYIIATGMLTLATATRIGDIEERQLGCRSILSSVRWDTCRPDGQGPSTCGALQRFERVERNTVYDDEGPACTVYWEVSPRVMFQVP